MYFFISYPSDQIDEDEIDFLKKNYYYFSSTH